MKINTKKLAESYINYIFDKPKKIIAIALIVLVLCTIYTVNHLKINNDLSSLLPTHTPSVLALKESTKRFGSSDKFIIALRGDDPVLLSQLQTKIKKEMDTNWKDVLVSAQIKRDNQFFIDHALLYLPVEHLERIRDNLGIIQRDLSDAVNPFLVNLESANDTLQNSSKKKPKKSDNLVWFNSDIPQELGLPDEAADAFKGFYNATTKKNKDSVTSSNKKIKEWDTKANIPDSLKTFLIGQDKTDSSFHAIVTCKLTGSSTNLIFTEKVINRANKLLEPLQKQHGDKVILQIQGSYEGLKDVEALKSDGVIATIISIILIIILVIGFFRSFLAAFLLISQILFAAGIMLFFTALIYGQLNPYTLFVAAIIIGMGIDFSIHMMGNAQRLGNIMNLKEALTETINSLLKPMFLGALTTVAGLLTLLIADFKGFYEFGVIASIGVTLAFITAIFGLPVLIAAVGGLPKNHQVKLIPDKWSDNDIKRKLNKAVIALTAIIVLFLCFSPWTEFEYNFRNLRPAKEKKADAPVKIKSNVAMETKRTGSQPAAVMGDSPEELDKLYDTLMTRLNKDKDPMLRSFLTLKTFVPTQNDQEERLEIIEEIGDLIHARVFNNISGDDSVMVKKLRSMVDVKTFGPKDIPKWALNILTEIDGQYGRIGFIYGKYKSWDAREMKKFKDKYGSWKFGEKDLRVYSSAFIVSDVIEAVKHDSTKMAIFIFFVLIITLCITLKNLKLVLISMIPLSSAVLFTIGIMGFINLSIGLGKIGMYNVIVIPMVLGIGIDSTIHLLYATLSDPKKSLREIYNTTGTMVIMASATTIASFIGMLLINHKGLRTIGELAVIALVSTLVTALIYTPWLAKRFAKNNPDILTKKDTNN